MYAPFYVGAGMKKPNRKVDKVFIHCTAYSHQDLFGGDLVNAIRGWHQKRGWSDIGYHYLIDCQGKLLTGRNIEQIPAAQYMHNSRTIAICLDGLYEEQFNEKQFDTLKQWASQVCLAYDGNITFHGHCEVSNKTCPVFDYKKVLELDENGYRREQEIEHKPELRVLSLTCVGSDVKFVQNKLLIKADGVFGYDTFVAVVDFQIACDLEPDGIVGPITWKMLIGSDI